MNTFLTNNSPQKSSLKRKTSLKNSPDEPFASGRGGSTIRKVKKVDFIKKNIIETKLDPHFDKKVKHWKADRKDWVETYGIKVPGINGLVYEEPDSPAVDDDPILKKRRENLLRVEPISTKNAKSLKAVEGFSPELRKLRSDGKTAFIYNSPTIKKKATFAIRSLAHEENWLLSPKEDSSKIQHDVV